jgi:hypothetical protein
MIPVDLTWPEILLAANAGVMRRVNAVRKARQDRYGPRPLAGLWTEDINGALAEMALAKHLNAFWSGTVGRVDTSDVGPLHVRSKVEREHRLVILPNDPDDGIFVLVLVSVPTCHVCGWMRAGDVKRSDWLLPDQFDQARYFAPNGELQPMETLRAMELAP